MEWMLFVIVASAIVAFSIWQGVRRGRHLLELDKAGSSATARIVKRRTYTRKSGRRYQIVYQYPAGASIHKVSSFLSEAEYASTTDGGPLEIKYLPMQPKISAPLFTIAQAVEASRK